MPDRLPPNWGHEPEDGRDLDALLSVEELLTDEALLSGQLAGLSERQRPVAGAMFALRAAPAGSELAGEAAARGAFRALMKVSGPLPASAIPAGMFPAGAAWSLGEPGGAEFQHTLVLPAPAAGQGPRPPARHRHRRRAAGRPSWPVLALLGSAAAVVAVGAAAIAGTFSGSAGHQGQSADPSAAQMSTPASVSASGTQHVLGQGLATKNPAPSATPKASAAPGATASPSAASRASALCREYFSFRHPVDRATRREIFHELSQLAGTDSFWGVVDYCRDQQDTHLFTPPQPTSGGTWRFPGSRGGASQGGPDAGAGADPAGAGQASSGPGGDSGPRGSR